MPPDAHAELTRLQEQEEQAIALMEEHQRRIATLQALLEGAKRREQATGGIEARIRTAEEGAARAGREIAALRERIVAAEQALPADLRDEDDEA